MARSASAARAPALLILLGTALLALSGTDARADDVTPSSGGLDADPSSDVPPAGPLPDVRWYTLDTPHFHIHFYADERPLADHTAIVAERAYILLTRYLNWRPSGRINITLNDHTDYANGFASSVPQNFLFGYGAPPGPFDELNDFDDYLKLLITHELTHVVHLDTIMGFARIYNAVFGKLYAPNLSQANWWVEGLAVVQESRQTTAGRLRSAVFDMELRAPFLEGELLGLDAVSHGPLVFPGGTAAYLYGSSILKYVEDRYGPEKLREISHRYGRGLIPGAMNRIAARALGKPYVGIFGPGIMDEWRESMSHRYALQVDGARRRGPVDEERRLTFEAPGPRGDGLTPRFFPDGTVLYHRATTDGEPEYVRLDIETGEKRVLTTAYGAGLATTTPDGRALIYQRLSLLPLRWRISGNPNLSWTDLYRLDLETGDVRELTHVRRAAEPDVSPDGTLVACTVGGTGTRQLAVVSLEGGGAPKILAADVPGLVYSPAWSPDGRLIAYSRWKDGGFRDIHVYDVAARTDRALAVDRAMDVDPRFSPDGRYLLFSSDRTGIYNVFARELATGRLYQVTNVLGGAFQPAVSPDGQRLVYMGFTSAGYDLFTAPFDPWTWTLAQPFVNPRPEPTLDPASLADSPDAKPGEGPVSGLAQSIGPYQPWQYMYPRTWIVGIATNPLGVGNSAEVRFTVTDPAANHAIAFNALVPSDGDASLRLDYAYSRLWPSFGLTATRSAVQTNDLIIDGARVNYRQHSSSASASMGLPVLRRPVSSADVSFGYTYAAYAPADTLPVPEPTGGITIPPEHGPDASLFLTWTFQNVRSFPYSISGQKGRRVQLSLNVSNQSLGGRFSTTRASWYWTEYFTPPWARLHAFALLYSGGLQAGEKANAFGLGGYVEQDLLRNLFLNRRQCCTYQRGYLPNSAVGDQYHLVSAEYRFPLLWIERGYETFPIYLQRLHGAVFTDIGNAFFGNFRFQDLRYGVGAELRLQLSIVYYIKTEIQVGVARGLSDGGGNQVYFVTTFPF